MFLRKSLRDSQIFVNNYCGKIKRDFQYQLENVKDWALDLEHLQAVLKEFDLIAGPDEDVLIRYFCKKLCLSLLAQMDYQNRDLDLQEDAIEKTVKAEAKAVLQLVSEIRKIDSWCSWGDRLLMKKDKEHETSRNDKTKSHSPPANINQTQIQASNKDKRQESQRVHLVTKVNITEIFKKDKDKNKDKKDLSHIEYHACRQKSYYANKCPKKPKNKWRSRLFPYP